MSHYVKLTSRSSTITIDKTSQQKSKERRPRRRSYTSRKAFARREGRGTVIEIYHLWSTCFPADSLSPCEAGTVSDCKLHSQVIHHTMVPSLLRLQSNEDATRYVSTEGPRPYSFLFLPFFVWSPLGLCFGCPLIVVDLDRTGTRGEEGSSIFALSRWACGSRISSTRFRISRSSFVNFCNAWSFVSLSNSTSAIRNFCQLSFDP